MSAVEVTGPYHEDFSWLPDSIKYDANARFAARVRTMVSGCCAIASITQQHMLDTANGSRTLLSEQHMGSLVGLLVPLMDLLDDAADDQIMRIDAEATKGAAK